MHGRTQSLPWAMHVCTQFLAWAMHGCTQSLAWAEQFLLLQLPSNVEGSYKFTSHPWQEGLGVNCHDAQGVY